MILRIRFIGVPNMAPPITVQVDLPVAPTITTAEADSLMELEQALNKMVMGRVHLSVQENPR